MPRNWEIEVDIVNQGYWLYHVDMNYKTFVPFRFYELIKEHLDASDIK